MDYNISVNGKAHIYQDFRELQSDFELLLKHSLENARGVRDALLPRTRSGRKEMIFTFAIELHVEDGSFVTVVIDDLEAADMEQILTSYRVSRLFSENVRGVGITLPPNQRLKSAAAFLSRGP